MKNKVFNFLKNGGLFIILLLITLYVLCNNFKLNDLILSLKSVNVLLILLGCLLMILFQLCEALNIKRCLKITGCNVSFIKCIKYAIVGFFFSSITPSSSGGQPMQVYYMYNDGIKVSQGSLALLLELTSYLTNMIVLAIIGFVISNNLIVNKVGNIKILLILGVSFNIIILGFIITCIFFKKASSWLVNVIIKLLRLLRVKNVNKIADKLNKSLLEYQNSVTYIKNNKAKFINILITSCFQVICMHSVTFIIYKSFGLASYSYITILSLQAILYVAVASLPFPGAVGISESAFLILFKMIYSTKLLPSAMILSRTVNFYLCVIVNGIVLSILYFKNKKKKII